MAYVQSITVLNPTAVNILVQDQHNDLPQDQNWDKTAKAQPGTACLYNKDASQTSEQPFAFLAQPSEWILQVEVNGIPSDWQNNRCTVILSDKDTYATPIPALSGKTNVSAPVDVTGDTATFPIAFNKKTPHGLFGRYTITLRNIDTSTDQVLGGDQGIPLEAYYLSVQDLSDYLAAGVPLLLLRMFVIPQRYAGPSHTAESWIKTVVNIVFGSQKPFSGAGSNTVNHWLNYDSFHGTARFSSAWGGQGLNLTAWLDAFRNWQQHGVITPVNCYDQAAITEIALALGLPHQQINWEYHQVYGFIKQTELVGWGPCNNPYFLDDSSLAVCKDPNDPRREPFRNHAYLSWSPTALPPAQYTNFDAEMKGVTTHDEYLTKAAAFEQQNNVQLLMIDSCAGPHVGTETRAEYDSKIDLIKKLSDCKSTYVQTDSAKNPSDWTEEHHLGTGITTWNTWKCPNLLPASSADTFAATCASIIQLARGHGIPDITMAGPVNPLQDAFQAYMKTLAAAQQWPDSRSYTIRPYTTANGTTVSECKTNYSVAAGGKLSGEMALRVATNTTAVPVQQALAEHLAFNALTSMNSAISAQGAVMGMGATVPVVGTKYRRAFVFNNFAVEVYMPEDFAWSTGDVMQSVFDSLTSLPYA